MQSLIDTFLSLDPKDKFTTVGIIVTAIIGSFTLFFSILNNQRNLFASTILKERLDSLNDLKNHSANFIALVLSSLQEVDKLNINYKELNYYSRLIAYQLNDTKNEEIKVLEELTYLMKLIQLKVISNDISEMGIFIKDNNLKFFRGLNLSNYSIQRLSNLIIKEIHESADELNSMLKIQIKSEWEKIKKSQRSLKVK